MPAPADASAGAVPEHGSNVATYNKTPRRFGAADLVDGIVHEEDMLSLMLPHAFTARPRYPAASADIGLLSKPE